MDFLPFCLLSGGFSAVFSGMLFQFFVRRDVDDTHIRIVNVNSLRPLAVRLDRFVDNDLVHQCVQNFRCQMFHTGIFPSDGNQLLYIVYRCVGLTDLLGELSDFRSDFLLLRFVPLGQPIELLVGELSRGVVLIGLAEQIVNLQQTLFILFRKRLLLSDLVLLVRHLAVDLLLNKDTLKLLQIGQKLPKLLLHLLLQHRFPDIVNAASIHPAVSLVPAATEILIPVRHVQRELCAAVGAVEQSRKDTGRSRFGGAAFVCPQKLHLVPNRSVDDRFVSVLYDDTPLLGGRHPLFALEAEPQRFQSLCHADIGGVVEDSANRRAFPAIGVFGAF